MSTIADLRLPAADTVLATTFERAPEATFELESSVSKTRPSLWVSGVDCETANVAFEADPSVEEAELLVETGSRLLYDVTFSEGTGATRLWDDLLANGGSLLEARASDGWWQVTVRYRNRDTLGDAYDRLSIAGSTPISGA